jgi:hypothetical protein
MDRKPMRSLIKDGPSLREFLAPPVIDVSSSEDPVPYTRDIRGENQKGFSDPLSHAVSLYVTCAFHAAQLLLIYFFRFSVL